MLRLILAAALSLGVHSPLARAGQGAEPLDPAAITAVVADVADAVAREYFDAAAGMRIAEALRQHLNNGRYTMPADRQTLARALTRDLYAASSDKHLSVTVQQTPGGGTAPTGSRAADVARTNGGVARAEVGDGIGYVNLTQFWRLDETRDILATTMRTLAPARALIVDLRQNTGGSPDTVAFLLGYFFDQSSLPLFDIVPRAGSPTSYRTLAALPAEHDARRPLFVLTSARTFSAGEGLAYLLQERRRATIVGERTAGAANPGRPIAVRGGLDVTVPVLLPVDPPAQDGATSEITFGSFRPSDFFLPGPAGYHASFFLKEGSGVSIRYPRPVEIEISGAAFVYDAADNHLKPNLQHIKLFGVVTSYGSPWWVTRLLAGDPGRKVMMRALKPMCGKRVRSFYLAHYDMDRSTAASRQAFLERVRAVVSRI